MTLKRIRFALLILISAFALSGCSASLFSIGNLENKANEKYLTYENPEFGVSFKYPDYYGEPQLSSYTGKDGSGFLLSFTFASPEDPYVVYVAGTSADFESFNQFERVNYNGGLQLADICRKKSEALNFVQQFGSKCQVLSLNAKDVRGVNLNAVFLDAVSNSIENVSLLNYPAGLSNVEYNGLQFGFKVPLSYLEYGRFDSVEIRGEKAVLNLLKDLDRMKLDSNLSIELDRFKNVVESVEFFD